jgi:glycosyltransferase involved in cell wall biosynthesis
MASKVAVIGSDSGAIPNVMGDAGLIFPEGDVQALTKRLQQLQMNSQLRQELGKIGRERVLANFTHQTIADMTIDVYREIAQEN